MTAERMFREYKNLKKEQGILLFQLEQFSGIEESDVIDSMMFGHAETMTGYRQATDQIKLHPLQ